MDPVKHSQPQVSDSNWPTHWIDQFTYANIKKNQLKPAPDADPITLVRRLHFDLTGLPPKPQEVKNFTTNPSAKA